MFSKVRLGVSEAAYLRPLLEGLQNQDSPFELISDLPAVHSVHLNKRTSDIRGAFLSPIDYARYGGSYRIVPQVCVSSSNPTGTIMLSVKSRIRNIQKVAVDIRVTSEIILAKIILLERMRNLPENRSEIEFIPMMPDIDAMLQKADAALIVNFSPPKLPPSKNFTIDLVEEWSDMTGFPYVHGFWVSREEDIDEEQIGTLIKARDLGTSAIDRIARDVARQTGLPAEECRKYFDSFSYDFDKAQVESISEYIQFAYYHGILSDVPEIKFFEAPKTNLQRLN